MKYLQFGEEKKEVSVIGVGCMRISGMDKESLDGFIKTALENGINFFDHADIYGGGRSEEVFGEVLKEIPELREKMVIQSKCGINDGMYDFSKEHILKSVDGILERLHTDYLDSLLLHRPDVLMELEEVRDAFNELKQAGKVKNFGVSNMNRFQVEMLQEIVDVPLVANQLQMSIVHSPLIDEGINVNTSFDGGIVRNSGTLEYCKANKMIIQTWSPVQIGFFGGTFIDHPNYEELNVLLQKLADEKNTTKDAIAYAWLLRLPQQLQVITGTTKSERIINAAKATEVELTRREWYDLYKAAGNQLP